MPYRRLAAVSLLALAGVPAAAGAQNVFDIVAGATLTWDNNIFRVADSVDPVAQLGAPTKGDTIRILYAGVRIDKPFGLQRFELSVVETQSRYDTFTRLNFDATSGKGAWHWKVTPRLAGTASLEHREALVPFSDFTLPVRNVRETNTTVFDADWNATGAWHLLAGATTEEQKSEIPNNQQPDFRLKSPNAGISYKPNSGSSVSLTRSMARGEYINRPIDVIAVVSHGFEEATTEAKLSWRVSGRSTVDARFGRMEHTDAVFEQRNFSGNVGELAWAWGITGKLRLQISAQRSLAPTLEIGSSYRVDELLTLAPTWQLTSKASVRLVLDQTRTEFRQPIIPPPGGIRKDTARNITLSADWTAWRNLAVTASVQRQTRDSNNAVVIYQADIVKLGADYTW